MCDHSFLIFINMSKLKKGNEYQSYESEKINKNKIYKKFLLTRINKLLPKPKINFLQTFFKEKELVTK